MSDGQIGQEVGFEKDTAPEHNIINVMPSNKCFYDIEVICDVVRACLRAHRDKWAITRVVITKDDLFLHICHRGYSPKLKPVTPDDEELAKKTFHEIAMEESVMSYNRQPVNT